MYTIPIPTVLNLTSCVRNIGPGVECIDALLRAGADRSIRDMNNKTALDAAVEAGRKECARALNLEIRGAKVRTFKQCAHIT